MAVCILACLSLVIPLRAEGLDELYEKPSSEKSWGQIAADLVGYDGFTKSHALVVGISDYTAGYGRLPTSQDPIRIRDFLIDEAGFDYVHVLTDEKATYARIRQLMVNVFPGLVDGDDRFFFYWSGHGTQRNNRRDGQVGYLPLASSERDDFASMGDIGRWDDLIDGRHVLFFLDACLSGLAGAAPKADDRPIDLNELVKPAHHLITAGTSDEETIAGDRWGGSVFTNAFLRAVSGAADTDSFDFPKDGVVSLFELIKHLRGYIPREAESAGWGGSITPQLRDLGGSDGEFFFLTSEERLAKLEREGKMPSGEILGGDTVGKSDEMPPLSPVRIRQVQDMLIKLGFQLGEPDGVLDARTRAAIIAFQRSIGEPATVDLTQAEERQLAIAYANHLVAGSSARSDQWPDSTFQDCIDCPEMVVIPPGSFVMGSPTSEEERDDDEGPQHHVTISAPFALGKYEVTFDEWGACVVDGDCKHEPDDEGWGRGDHPVINVSWQDAQQYVAWLSNKTGQTYRLPSEAEWEYAARAGTTTRRSWGDDLGTCCNFANGFDLIARRAIGWGSNPIPCEDNYVHTAPVGSFSANSFGLFDMHGNVWEWIEDRYHASYVGAPSDGSPWLQGYGILRVLRSGAWINKSKSLRSATRFKHEPGKRTFVYGFRVARTLPP